MKIIFDKDTGKILTVYNPIQNLTILMSNWPNSDQIDIETDIDAKQLINYKIDIEKRTLVYIAKPLIDVSQLSG